MTTATEDSNDQHPVVLPAHNAELTTMPHCTRCKLPYVPSKSTSALKLTYCSFLCELGDLGFSIVGLEHMERKKKPETPAEPPAEPVAAE